MRASIERLRLRHGPRVAEALVALTTYAAKRRLRRSRPITVLVDNSVLFHAVTHETAWISTGISKWGEHEFETGYSARIPVRRKDRASREYESVQYLAGIVHLAKSGYLLLMTSGELEIERWKQPTGRFTGYGIFDHNVFSSTKFSRVDALPPVVIGPQWMNQPSLDAQQRRRLSHSDDPLYRGLVTQLGTNNSQDAWHIWTAETHGVFCFLTMDFKLCKTMESRCNQEPVRSLQTKVWTPQQLGRYLRLMPVDPTLLSYNDASFPVRADLHWPDNKRRRPQRANKS